LECKAEKKDLGAVDRGHPKSLGILVGKLSCTVEFEIGFIAEHSMILFLTYILKCSNLLWLALSQALAFAYFPCSEVLHVKCRLLPEDLVFQLAIGVIFVASRGRTELLPEDCFWPFI
jgi:hypothetical protein